MVHWSLLVTCIKVSPCCTKTQGFVDHVQLIVVFQECRVESPLLFRGVSPGWLGQQMVVVRCAMAAVLAYKIGQVWYSQLICAEGWPTGQEMKTLSISLHLHAVI